MFISLSLEIVAIAPVLRGGALVCWHGWRRGAISAERLQVGGLSGGRINRVEEFKGGRLCRRFVA
jgi:hypothetical protein